MATPTLHLEFWHLIYNHYHDPVLSKQSDFHVIFVRGFNDCDAM